MLWFLFVRLFFGVCLRVYVGEGVCVCVFARSSVCVRVSVFVRVCVCGGERNEDLVKVKKNFISSKIFEWKSRNVKFTENQCSLMLPDKSIQRQL